MPEPSSMPTWLTDVLRQFPVVIVVGLVGWYAFRHIRDQHRDVIERLEKRSAELVASKDTEIKRLVKTHADELKRIRESKDAEIKRLAEQVADLQKERDRLLAQILSQEGET